MLRLRTYKNQTRHLITVSGLSLCLAVSAQEQSPLPQAPLSQAPLSQATGAPTIEQSDTPALVLAPARVSPFNDTEWYNRLELNAKQADGQDDADRLQRDTAELLARWTFGFEHKFSQSLRFETRLQLASRRFTEEPLNNDDEVFSYELERLFAQWRTDRLRWRLGRQPIDDPLQALADADLDGLRMTWRGKDLRFDASYTREDGFEASTFTVSQIIDNGFVALQIRPQKNTLWMPYVLYRSDKTEDSGDESLWYGLQGIVEPKKSPFRYWLHVGTRQGTQNNASGDTDLGGHAINFGLNYKGRGAWDPVYTLALAASSGDADEKRFRQSGLHDNDFSLNDKNRFRYLGEVLDPELTNIEILTAGLGLEPSSRWTTDIAVHYYRQVSLSDRLRGSDIEYEPTGLNRELGIGADLIVAYEADAGFELKASLGQFDPGAAFESSVDLAWVAALELDWRF